MKETLVIFDDIATMGTESGIQTYRNKLITDINTVYAQYAEANSLRNPYKDMELYILPSIIAFLSWICSRILDNMCNHSVCEATELAFYRIYVITLAVILFLAWK